MTAGDTMASERPVEEPGKVVVRDAAGGLAQEIRAGDPNWQILTTG